MKSHRGPGVSPQCPKEKSKRKEETEASSSTNKTSKEENIKRQTAKTKKKTKTKKKKSANTFVYEIKMVKQDHYKKKEQNHAGGSELPNTEPRQGPVTVLAKKKKKFLFSIYSLHEINGSVTSIHERISTAPLQRKPVTK